MVKELNVTCGGSEWCIQKLARHSGAKWCGPGSPVKGEGSTASCQLHFESQRVADQSWKIWQSKTSKDNLCKSKKRLNHKCLRCFYYIWHLAINHSDSLEGCACPRVFSGKVSGNLQQRSKKIPLGSPGLWHAIPAKVWALSGKGNSLGKAGPAFQNTPGRSPQRLPQPSTTTFLSAASAPSFWVCCWSWSCVSVDPESCALWSLVKEEGRGTRNGYEASKGSKGISGL